MNPSSSQSPPANRRRRTNIPTAVIRRVTTFNRYIRIVQKQVHPHCRIASATLSSMNAIVNTLFDRIGMEATDLARKEKRSTLLCRDVAYACRFLFPDPVFSSIDKLGNENISKYDATFLPDNDEALP